MEELVDTTTTPENYTVVARDEEHSDTSGRSKAASEDGEWGPDSEDECSCGSEILTSDSEIDGDSSTMASSSNLNDGDLREIATRLIREDPCDKKCLEGVGDLPVFTIAHDKRREEAEHAFQNDPLYDPPNDEDTRKAKSIQKDRQAAFKKKKREREAAAAAAKHKKETAGVAEAAGEAMQTDGRDDQETVPASSKGEHEYDFPA
ncbi:hypothetical protein PInf_009786 [Phytophthora infestans]|nr:hypothetical protein PInf_009786 [Phytophthora infestans]